MDQGEDQNLDQGEDRHIHTSFLEILLACFQFFD